MKKNEMLINGFLYTTIGALTPVLSVLATGVDLTNRVIFAMIVAGIISGCAAAKSFSSTTFADYEVENGRTLKPSIKRK